MLGLLIAITVGVWLQLLVLLGTISRVNRAAIALKAGLAKATQQAQQMNAQ